MKIAYIFLTCHIIFTICFAQVVEKDAVTNYLTAVGNAVWKVVKSYGLSNFPDVDVSLRYEGYEAGLLYLEDGFIMDMEGISCVQKSSAARSSSDNVTINTRMELKNLLFFRDFRFEPDKPENIRDPIVGATFIRPEKFEYVITIIYHLYEGKVTGTLDHKESSVNKKALELYPQNGLTDRLRKGRNYTDIFPRLDSLWIPIFQSFLEEAVKTIAFPPVYYPVDRLWQNN